MRRRGFLIGAAAVGALSLTARGVRATAPAAKKPMNLLLITVDDLDWSLLGFLNGRRNLTPNLDALAARSFRFVNNRTVAPICQPAREAMMTGLLPHHSGATGFTPVKVGTPTLTTVLQGANYYAAAIHKIEHMQPWSCFPWNYAQNSHDRNPFVYRDGVRLAIEEAVDQGRPFYVNCNLNDPHRPFYGSEGGNAMDHDETGPYKVAREITAAEVDVPPHLDDLPPVRQELAQYWNSVQRLDFTIGEVLRALEESGQATNTAILFSSDHGMPFPFAKGTCYDHGTRVPVLLSWPGMGPPRTFPSLTTNVDIMPTLLDLLGVAAPGGLDGRSWLPLILGQPFEDPEFVVTYVNTIASGVAYPMRAVQTMEHSLCFTPWADSDLKLRMESMSGLTFPAMAEAAKADRRMAARVDQYVNGIAVAFYDLKADPGQRVNLIDSSGHRQLIGRMKAYLLQEMERTGDPQLENFRLLLAGKKPVVTQDPARYRLQRLPGENDPEG